MFKIFKKYAVLDAVETNDYEAYCMYEQVRVVMQILVRMLNGIC